MNHAKLSDCIILIAFFAICNIDLNTGIANYLQIVPTIEG